jgi:hypothetical protein
MGIPLRSRSRHGVPGVRAWCFMFILCIIYSIAAIKAQAQNPSRNGRNAVDERTSAPPRAMSGGALR